MASTVSTMTVSLPGCFERALQRSPHTGRTSSAEETSEHLTSRHMWTLRRHSSWLMRSS